MDWLVGGWVGWWICLRMGFLFFYWFVDWLLGWRVGGWIVCCVGGLEVGCRWVGEFGWWVFFVFVVGWVGGRVDGLEVGLVCGWMGGLVGSLVGGWMGVLWLADFYLFN